MPQAGMTCFTERVMPVFFALSERGGERGETRCCGREKGKSQLGKIGKKFLKKT
jgi:hypothetical protein